METRLYLLLGGVVKLVLVGAAEARLEAAISPQSFHGGQQLVRERFRVLHARYDVDNQLRVRLHPAIIIKINNNNVAQCSSS